MLHDLVVVGAGAAGFFAAINAKIFAPKASVLLLEKGRAVLAKVRISGGGRCNATHHCFDPKTLIQNYPRGHKELLGPFHAFQPKDTVEWFKKRGVKLKTEADGRMFPTTDSSQTIIDCLLKETQKTGVCLKLEHKIESISYKAHIFTLLLKDGSEITCRNLLLATGSSKDGHQWAKSLGHTITPLIPSLFTFNVPNSPLKELSGIAKEDVQIQIEKTSFKQRGPLLITHFGFSGPAILKLSAWAAPELFAKNYHFKIFINWLPNIELNTLINEVLAGKKKDPSQHLEKLTIFDLPKKLKRALLGKLAQKKLMTISDKELRALAEKVQRDPYEVQGKTTNKEEFVTCGGISRKEINWKTMESKLCKGLYFAGEILDIDGITGGFNFQNAWTTGYRASYSIANSMVNGTF